MGEGMKAYRIVFAIVLLAMASPAWADDLSAAATAGSVSQLQNLGKKFLQSPSEQRGSPNFLPQYQTDEDEDGMMGTYQPNGGTVVPSSPFFRSLGTNGRTCFTCHQPGNGWALSAKSAGERFADDPADPLFRLIDGAVCPTAEVSTPDAMRGAYKLVIEKGLIRIPMPLLSGQEFEVTVAADPYDCNTGLLTGIQTGFLSFYRRPLPAANLNALTAIMWDGREPNLFHQSVDATLGHAEGRGDGPPVPIQNKIVEFEGCTTVHTSDECNEAGIPVTEGVITAQAVDNAAGSLTENGAAGGPVALAQPVAGFEFGMNDQFGSKGFTPEIFSLYNALAFLTGSDPQSDARRKIARGQQIFNSVQFNISGVAGLNDDLGLANIRGTCGTCHNTPNIGNNSTGRFMNIGVTAPNPPHLEDAALLPVFMVACNDRAPFPVTDLGRAMISGKCADVGKTKVPVLRALPGRSPYFHNGAATAITNVVEFYNERFQIGLTEDQIADLAAFLETL
jgi:hypothetical protein